MLSTSENSLREEILYYLKQHGGCTVRQMDKALHPERWGTSLWGKVWWSLVKEGLIRETGDGTITNPKRVLLMKLPGEELYEVSSGKQYLYVVVEGLFKGALPDGPKEPEAFARMLAGDESIFVKIGKTGQDDPMSRLAQLQTSNPRQLTMWALRPVDVSLNPQNEEDRMHAILRPYAAPGGKEWFRLAPFVSEFIQDNFIGSVSQTISETVADYYTNLGWSKSVRNAKKSIKKDTEKYEAESDLINKLVTANPASPEASEWERASTSLARTLNQLEVDKGVLEKAKKAVLEQLEVSITSSCSQDSIVNF